jgi:hypothetical protein
MTSLPRSSASACARWKYRHQCQGLQNQDTSAGIHTLRVRALDPFLSAAHDGRIRLGNNNSVVVLDEVGRIGTVQVLDLLRLRQQHGFKLVLVGDDE